MLKGIIAKSEDTKNIIKLLKKEDITMTIRRLNKEEDVIVIEPSFLKYQKLKAMIYCLTDVTYF